MKRYINLLVLDAREGVVEVDHPADEGGRNDDEGGRHPREHRDAFLSATPELFAVFLLTSLSLPISANISSILNLSLNRNSTPLTVAYHIVFPIIKITINFTTFPCLLQCAIATKKKIAESASLYRLYSRPFILR